MPKDDKLLELDENLDLDELGRVENRFDYFLRENDLLYEKRIGFNVAYNSFNKNYEINITPAKESFDSKKYFMFHFETTFGQEKLGKFAKENNVGFVTY